MGETTAVVVKVGTRSYIVDTDYEQLFDNFTPGVNVEGMNGLQSFYCQYMRRGSKVDEASVIFSLYEVKSVRRIEYQKILDAEKGGRIED